MNQKFIDQVRTIVVKNISDENFGVPELSSLLGLSPSQTLRKIKANSGKSANQYIREIRLEKAAKLLKQTDQSIAEISYLVGFSSASYFNKSFRKYYNVTPGDYKTNSINLNKTKINKKKKDSSKIKVFITVFLALLLVIIYLETSPFISKSTPLNNSIAVLPFKDFSPKNNQWLSDGVSDNILHSLAQMEKMKVISFTSSSTYRNTDKKIPEIAEELGVSYVLEGSVRLVKDRIKIITQLINANDEHIWSKEYEENAEDIIKVQNDVAEEVIKQLKITLSPNEERKLDKYPTQNMEAYNLYLRSHLENDSRKFEDIEQNIVLNKQAISLDSSFVEAYEELAMSYYHLSKTGIDLVMKYDGLESRENSKHYAEKAIQINTNANRAWLVKAMLMHHKDWDLSKEYHKKAIALNPNDALAHTMYAEYFLYNPKPNVKKYLDQLIIAQRVNPLSSVLAKNFASALIINNQFEKAEKYLEEHKFLFSGIDFIKLESKLIAYKNKDWNKIIPFLNSKIEKDPNNASLYNMLGDSYDGIKNNDSIAVIYHKKAYELDSTNYRILQDYSYLLAESKMSNEFFKIKESANYKSILSKPKQLNQLWFLYYHQEEYNKALEIADSYLSSRYTTKVWTHAQLGDRKKVDSISKKLYWGTGQDKYWRSFKAFTHAILKDRDSMYYYLENARFDGTTMLVNSRREFDPYRNEDRFKAILKANYLPVSE
ncbi:helix-turn-helix domain-containing protein [Flavobacteriaceae bacterium]|nr:helix-turn-helix domain-containing protein [Flavobacteriaceae bacterium]